MLPRKSATKTSTLLKGISCTSDFTYPHKKLPRQVRSGDRAGQYTGQPKLRLTAPPITYTSQRLPSIFCCSKTNKPVFYCDSFVDFLVFSVVTTEPEKVSYMS
ncbi:hypothetical protein TNCV_702781 [Trichonephila clavipes]|nr:hypothetical protein TNCV_702781 [Trichonephila clavipes]